MAKEDFKRKLTAILSADAVEIQPPHGWRRWSHRPHHNRLPGGAFHIAARLEGLAEPGGICISKDDPDNEYIANALSENKINALSKIPNLFVIAKESSFS